jgi:outer membrane protein assembly factor BamD (BamD/ComL family)
MKRGLLVLFTLALIGCGVYGAYFFSQLEKAESLVNKAIIAIHDGNLEDARATLADAASRYNYRVVLGPSLYLLADTYMKEGKYEAALQTFKTLLSDEGREITDPWTVRTVLATSRLYRRGTHRISKRQADILIQSVETIVSKLAGGTVQDEWGLDALRSELSHIRKRVLDLGFKIHLEEFTREELSVEARTELGLLYLNRKEYESARGIFEGLHTPAGELGLAKVYIATGEEIKGIGILEELMQYDRTGAIRAFYLKEVYEYGEELYRNKRFTEAVKVFEIIGRQSDSMTYADLSLYYVALYYYSVKSYSSALAYADKALSNGVAVSDEDALMLKGYIFYDRREFVRALKVFNEFKKRYPRSEKLSSAREWSAMCERSIKYLD